MQNGGWRAGRVKPRPAAAGAARRCLQMKSDEGRKKWLLEQKCIRRKRKRSLDFLCAPGAQYHYKSQYFHYCSAYCDVVWFWVPHLRAAQITGCSSGAWLEMWATRPVTLIQILGTFHPCESERCLWVGIRSQRLNTALLSTNYRSGKNTFTLDRRHAVY